ncbi:putative integral membrane protein [Paenochrobactrum gallinarii]|uniref:Putative integral membrane protein n=1 Tax=Paenochrobactrum gallinarii TaxID=643673 RepID=A0A841LYX1_9HYPH|nr:LapA family protein [Paenochrobactrum gallinarii]MBB6261697.1 putative integral membrane protein [Paenochrobactrum gallinarii]
MKKIPTRRLVTLIILVPLAVILIALSVANRMSVTVTFDPFNPGNPALSYTAPLFVWLFATLLVGLVLGGTVTWLAQGKHRKQVKIQKLEIADIKRQNQQNLLGNDSYL